MFSISFKMAQPGTPNKEFEPGGLTVRETLQDLDGDMNCYLKGVRFVNKCMFQRKPPYNKIHRS